MFLTYGDIELFFDELLDAKVREVSSHEFTGLSASFMAN
jgi:hypothetical protein